MDQASQSSALTEKLTAPVMAIIARRRDDLMPLLEGDASQAAQAALRNDENVRKVATFCYPLLPGLLRLAVKEHVFVSFVLDNREKLLIPLMATKAATAP